MASPANSEHRISSLKFEHDLERWIKDTLTPQLGSWQLLELVPLHMMPMGLVTCATLQHEKEHPEHLLRLDLEVCQSQQLARGRLYERLNEMVHPVFAENGGPLLALGDARLVTCLDMTGIPARAYFTRNNVIVAIDMGGIDITEIANLGKSCRSIAATGFQVGSGSRRRQGALTGAFNKSGSPQGIGGAS